MFAESQQFSVIRTPVPRHQQLGAGFAQPLLQAGRQRNAGSPRCARLVGVPEMHLTCATNRHGDHRRDKHPDSDFLNKLCLLHTLCLKFLRAGLVSIPALLEKNTHGLLHHKEVKLLK